MCTVTFLPIGTTDFILTSNLYQNQLKKINAVIEKLHEDLQYDYLKEMEELSLTF